MAITVNKKSLIYYSAIEEWVKKSKTTQIGSRKYTTNKGLGLVCTSSGFVSGLSIIVKLSEHSTTDVTAPKSWQ
jgi:hypothetical protein